MNRNRSLKTQEQLRRDKLNQQILLLKLERLLGAYDKAERKQQAARKRAQQQAARKRAQQQTQRGKSQGVWRQRPL